MSTLVIFDIDGTLLYSNAIDSRCFAATYEDIYRQTFPTIDWRQYPHVTDTTIFKTLIQHHFEREVQPDEVDQFTDQYLMRLQKARTEAPEEFREVPAAKETLEYLLGEPGFAVGIATGGWERPARFKLKHLEMPTADLYMSFADGKLQREAIVQESIDLATTAGVHFERVVYVGDAVWDVRTTRNMGIPFIGIRRQGDHETLLKVGAQQVLQDYSDRSAFLRAITEAEVPLRI